MTDDELRKLMERMSVDLERATPGPWKIGHYSRRCIARETDRSHKHDRSPTDSPCVWKTDFNECTGRDDTMGIAAEDGQMVVSADYTSVEIKMDDARHIVNCSPEKVRALLDALRQIITERDAAEDFIRRQIHPNHLCEQHMSLPPICSRSYAAQGFIAEARAKRPHQTPKPPRPA